MERIRVTHDVEGGTLTVWLGDPQEEYASTLTDDEVVVMKASDGRVLGFEVLHYRPQEPAEGLAVEAIVRGSGVLADRL